MENKEGILLSGAGRVESQAELSENEKRFSEIIDFLVDGLDDFIKKNNIDKVKFKTEMSRNFIKILRDHIKNKRNISIYEALKDYFNDKENGLSQFKQILSAFESFVEKEKEELKNITIQSVFSKLGEEPKSVADIMTGKPKNNPDGEEYIN